jgi:[NiFe] hydrogenase diaphorase moiety large subunit
MEFFKAESCGICTPCRAGNFILTEKVKKLQRGLGSLEDIEEITKWGKIIKMSSRCGLGKSSSNSLLFAVEKFKDYLDLRLVPSNESKNVEFDMEDAVEEYDSFIKDTQS